MEYKLIFTDIKADNHLFLRLDIHKPIINGTSPYDAPYLIQFVTGEKNSEDWSAKWIMRNWMIPPARVIREMIKILDATPLPAPIESIT